jgi:hypothetical protein
MITANHQDTCFTAVPATNECTGCLFDKQRASVCRGAGEAAIATGLPDCEAAPGFIYVLADARQRDLLAEAT